MNHLEFAAIESAALLPTSWDHWISAAEKLAGHDLDGNQETDGYCLDLAHDAFCAGKTPTEYVASIKA